MPRILVAGFQHETNTFAPSLADWAAFNQGDALPAYQRGARMLAALGDTNIPIAGFVRVARAAGWQIVPSLWAGASPSSFVTQDAFERIGGELLADVQAAQAQGLDAVYLDLHGAAVAEHAPDAEGELLARVRACVGPHCPIVASLDLHANVTARMLHEADALVAYRTYPHIDMADTGARAAQLLQDRWRLGQRAALVAHRLPFLIALNAQSTWMQPAQGVYEQLAQIETQHGATLSFCPGFPAADFAECGPVLWAHADTQAQAQAAADAFAALAGEPNQWRCTIPTAQEAVTQALALVTRDKQAPVVIADTEDNPGAGGDSNTTGLLHALLAQGAGRRFPGQIAFGLMFDPQAAAAAHAAGVGAVIDCALGLSVPTYAGMSPPPVQGRFTVRALSDGRATLQGPMMTGLQVTLGPCACLEIDGVLIAVVSGKAQLLDRCLLAMVGIDAQAMRLIGVKSSNHFRADFTPIASHVLVCKSIGPMAADPGDLPWQHLSTQVRTRP